MCSLSHGSRLSRGSPRGTGSGTDTDALWGTGLPTEQPACLCQPPGPGASAGPQLKPRSPQGEVEDRPYPSPQERAEGRASALLRSSAAVHNNPDRQRHRQTDADTQRQTDRAVAPALSHQGLRHTRPGPARVPRAAFEPHAPFSAGGRAHTHGRQHPLPRLHGPVPLVSGPRAPGRADDLGARGCCACAEAALHPYLPFPPFLLGAFF